MSEDTVTTGNPALPELDAALQRAGSMPTGAMVHVESSRAIAEVQAAAVTAKQYPRDEVAAFANLQRACRRPGLAWDGLYAYPKDGTIVMGASVRLAEAEAQCWGNILFGTRELYRDTDKSEMQAFAWDLQGNTQQMRTFITPHVKVSRRAGQRKLSDPREIYEETSNLGARRMRACLLSMIPAHVTEMAVAECMAVQLQAMGTSIETRIEAVVAKLEGVGVTRRSIEDWMGHKIEKTKAKEGVKLQAIYKALRDGHARKQQFFGGESEQAEKLTAELVGEKE